MTTRLSNPTGRMILAGLLLITGLAQGQTNLSGQLREIPVGREYTVHLLSPEPIQYVDVSTHDFAADLPVANVLRLKYFPDSASDRGGIRVGQQAATAVVTIVGRTFYAQYRLRHHPFSPQGQQVTGLEIAPADMRPLEFPGYSLGTAELRDHAVRVLGTKRSYFNVTASNNGLQAWLNNIHAVGDYVFIDVSFRNTTRIKYDIDGFRFNIRDKRIAKATNVQDIEISPEFTLYDQPYFRRNYRNVFVFRKFTFPGDKVLSVQLAEDPISGRTIELSIDYRDVLNADTL